MIDNTRPASGSHSQELSDAELTSFTSDILPSLIAEQIFDTLIAAADSALSRSSSDLNEERLAATIHHARTSAKSALLDEIKAIVRTGDWTRLDAPERTAGAFLRLLLDSLAVRLEPPPPREP